MAVEALALAALKGRNATVDSSQNGKEESESLWAYFLSPGYRTRFAMKLLRHALILKGSVIRMQRQDWGIYPNQETSNSRSGSKEAGYFR